MKIDPSSVKRILIIQQQPWGDVLLSTSYLAAIRDKFRGAAIDFLVKSPYHKLLHGNPYINHIHILREKKGLAYHLERIKYYSTLRKSKYDIVIDQQNNTGSKQLTLFSGARYKVGWKGSRYDFIYNLKAQRGTPRYSAAAKFDILGPLGIKEQPFELHYHINDGSFTYIDAWLSEKDLNYKKLITFSPGSPVRKKQWDLKNYAALADMIAQDDNYKILLLWGPGELEDVEKMKSMMKKDAVVALPTDFNQAAAMLKRSAMLICNDGGINHLSVATDTPALAFFGNTSPVAWSPDKYFPNHFHLYNPDFRGKPGNGFGITPEDGHKKFLEIVEFLKGNK